MIPLYLSLSGFLSYRERAEIDFSDFDLACIAGSNGAGKSSLLDGITWALFGQARKRDDSLINAHSKAAEVCLIFAYEGNVYRVLRSKPRDKPAVLEFHILQDQGPPTDDDGNWSPVVWLSSTATWKPLTERTLRDTEARIQETLRLDYDTFINASFFLQGKADQFTQQRPGDRKRILASILGLEIWERYRQQAADRRRGIELEIQALDGRLHEIAAELEEEGTRLKRLNDLEGELEVLSQAWANQEAALVEIRRAAATLEEQGRLVAVLARQLEDGEQRLSQLVSRHAEREEERRAFASRLERAAEIESAHASWLEVRARLEEWEEIAARFRENEKRRQGPLDEINAAQARLEQELQMLAARQAEIESLKSEALQVEVELAAAEGLAKDAEHRLARRARLDEELQLALERQAEAKAENPRLKAEMDELKIRIDQLQEVEGATCPLCGQPLNPADRQALIEALNAKGREMGDRFRANKALLEQEGEQVRELQAQIADLAQSEEELRAQQALIARYASRLDSIRSQCQEWEASLAPRLAEIHAELKSGTFAAEARSRLAQIDAELLEIGYDAAAHDADRRLEAEIRSSVEEMNLLEKARAALEPLAREIADLHGQIEALRVELERQREEYTSAAANLAASQAEAPDLDAAERQLLDLKENENRLRVEVGAARQKVLVLNDLKLRRQALGLEREALANRVAQFRQLERAFSKDGVPALLIEQALPQIETRANEVLDRLSNGGMSVRFVTQAAYKDKRRDDLRETLDIQISDSAGTRDYEMFSGGEAFRVNFAIRLALAEVLAQRAGARLQTLVIDEGFGSQDAEGRQRLIEAINLVRVDFSKILVITHIDELKDAFPNRIEVEKTARGSLVRVV
jgi:exonuclease SbcC